MGEGDAGVAFTSSFSPPQQEEPTSLQRLHLLLQQEQPWLLALMGISAPLWHLQLVPEAAPAVAPGQRREEGGGRRGVWEQPT